MRLSWLTSGSALVLAGLALLIVELATYKPMAARNLEAQADIVGINSASALVFGDTASATQTLSALKARPVIAKAGIYDVRGRPFAAWQANGNVGDPSSVLPPVAEGTRFDGGFVDVFHPMILDGNRVGTVYIRSSMIDLQRRLARDIEVLLVVIFVSLLVSGGISIKLGEKISEPILALARTAKEISEKKDYTVRASVRSEDEIGALVSTFNEMLGEIDANGQALQKANGELERRVNERTFQLEAANRELEAFSYSVSHDLRSPLRAVDGFGQALLEDCGDKLDEVGKSYLQRIRARTQEMSQLIDDLLNLARMTRAAMTLTKVDLSRMAHGIITRLRERDPDRQVNVRIADGLTATADGNLMHVVLENLLANAWKFSSKRADASIEFGTELVSPGESAFFVRDNGAGFDMAYVDKLFGAFQRLHSVEEFTGTGVGLATVRRVVARHGGRAWAVGKLGEGATFYFTLPA